MVHLVVLGAVVVTGFIVTQFVMNNVILELLFIFALILGNITLYSVINGESIVTANDLNKLELDELEHVKNEFKYKDCITKRQLRVCLYEYKEKKTTSKAKAEIEKMLVNAIDNKINEVKLRKS